jgi:hypothetical protein
MQSASITAAAITALRNRATTLLLTQAWLGRAEGFAFAQGAVNHLTELCNGPWERVAAQDAASETGYLPPAYLQPAWARLPVGVTSLTMAQVQELLTSNGIQLATDKVADSQLDGVEQLEHSEVPAVNLHDEHGTARADSNNGSGGHGALPAGEMVAPMVASEPLCGVNNAVATAPIHGLVLSTSEGLALAQLCKRITFTTCRALAASDDEAWAMISATDRVRAALAENSLAVR